MSRKLLTLFEQPSCSDLWTLLWVCTRDNLSNRKTGNKYLYYSFILLLELSLSLLTPLFFIESWNFYNLLFNGCLLFLCDDSSYTLVSYGFSSTFKILQKLLCSLSYLKLLFLISLGDFLFFISILLFNSVSSSTGTINLE